MKRLFLLFFFCVSTHAFSQYFEMIVETTSSNETFTIPTDGSLTYNYNVELFTFPFPNGLTTYNNVTDNLTHTFPNPGTHIIRILDGSLFPRINFSSSPDKLKIINITQWGNNPWTTMESAFEGCANLVLSASGAPNLSNVTSTNRMFLDATSLEDTSDNIGSWDMSTIEDMGFMFRNCTVFNEDISNWDTSSAESFTRMFQNAPAFDQNLGNWDVSNITTTDAIFAQAGISTGNYDQTIIGWGTLDPGETQIPTGLNMRFDNSTYCTSQATRSTLSNTPFNWVFIDSGLNCNTVSDEVFFITIWETTTANESITIPAVGGSLGYYIDWGDGQTNNSVTGSISHTYTNPGNHTVKIGGQFSRIEFAGGGDRLKIQSIEQWGDIRWTSMFNAFEGCSNLTYNASDAPDLSSVSELARMFNGCSDFNAQNLNNWDMSTIESVAFLFSGASTFNGDISGWDVSNINDFRNMFTDAIHFNQNISGWTINTSEPVDMEGMFVGAVNFNQPIGSWNVSQVIDMQFMFERALDFNQPLHTWNVSNVTNMQGMFSEAFDFNQSLQNWDISSVTTMTDMLNSSAMSIENYDTTLIGWNTLETGETQIPTNVTLGALDLEYCQSGIERQHLDDNFNWTFTGDILNCDDYAFITTWETTTANESITIPTTGSGYNYYVDWGDGTIDTNITGNATHTYPIAGVHTVKIFGDFPRIYFNNSGDRSKILTVEQWGIQVWTSMHSAFEGCNNLMLNADDTPDLSSTNSMAEMFRRTSNLEDLKDKIGSWNTSEVISMERLFNLSGFNENINSWDVGKVENMNLIFTGTILFNQPLNNWDVRSIRTMQNAFTNSKAFNQDISSWKLENIEGGLSFGSVFLNAEAFDQNLGGLDLSYFPDNSFFDSLFTDSNMSIENYDATLIGWATLDASETQIPSGISFQAIGIQFCEASLAKRDLIFGNNWAIIDGGIACPEEDKLIMVWKTTSNNENIRFQTTGSDNFYTVEWGDGTISNDVTGNEEHTYTQAGTYEVKLSGSFRLRYNNLPAASSTRLKLYEIKQWGANQWTSTADAFYGCENLKITATDLPDLSQVTDMSDMFRNCFNLEDLGGQMGTWDVSTVGNFNSMFLNTTSFSRSLGDWDLSSATNMSNMFNNSGMTSNSYDLTLIGWRNNPNTPSNINLGASGLTYCNAVNEHNYLDNDLNWLLNDAGINCPTNEPFITKWQTTTTNETITIPTTSSTQYFVDWGDGTPITTESGNATHNYTTAGLYDVKITGGFRNIRFNSSGDRNKIRSIEQWGAIEWNTMVRAFRGCSNLVINATDIPDLSKVTSMLFMFDGTTSLVDNGNRIGDWDISNVTQTGYMFDDSSFNENINNWDVSNVEFMGFMFRNNPNFNQPLDNWQLSNDVNLFEAFNNATAFNQNLGSWDISGVISMGNMLNNTAMSTENYDNTLIGWATLDAGETQIPLDISLGATGLNYCASETERNLLTSAPNNWTITDAGLFCGITIAPKVYLQGAALNPYTGEENLMRDDLHRENVIPITSPYSDAISLDPGIFSVLDHDALVDWVWVELRDATDNTQIIASKSALLQRDGDVLDAQYQTLIFEGIESGDYYIAIKHRNHLGILTANTVSLSATVTNLDLSTDANAVTGGSLALSDMGNGIFAMYAGDTTGDGNILNTDISNAINASGGIDVYSGADADMDGNILNTDIALIIQPNAGRIQQF